MKPRTIVFLSRSIYVEGVVSRLKQHSTNIEFHFIDPLREEYIERVVELHPTFVVINSEQGSGDQMCALCDLLQAFPEITILRLKPRY